MRRLAAAALIALFLYPAPSVVQTHQPTPPDSGPRDAPDALTRGELVEGGFPLALLSPDALSPAPDAISSEDIELPEGYSVDFRHYPTPREIVEFLRELEHDFPHLLEILDIGPTWQGRAIPLARVTNERVRGALHERPAMYLDGQHHAREMISSQVALYALWWLVSSHGQSRLVTHLLDTRVLYVVPSVNPDGNAIALRDNQEMRKSANPFCCDDDFDDRGNHSPDGQFDEDYSIGFGFGADSVYLYHFEKEWADEHPQDPFFPGWQRHQIDSREYAGRYTGALGGQRELIPLRDMDGDGRYNEDEIGGVDLNRNYDAHWDSGDHQSFSGTYGGPEPWSEPETRAIRELVSGTPHLATALTYHSGVDMILHPWGWSAEAPLPDAQYYGLLSARGSELSEANGFPAARHTWAARGLYAGSGSAMDYFYEDHGIYTWTPEVYGGSMLSRIDRVGATGTFSVGTSVGMAFNPRPEDIAAAAERWTPWTVYLLAATPNVELCSIGTHGDELYVVLGNDGILPVEVTPWLRGAERQILGGTGATRTLAGSRSVWAFPLDELAGADNVLEMESRLAVGTVPHTVERARWHFSIIDGDVVVEVGETRPFRDLGRLLGGWWPSAEYIDYRPARDVPLQVSPPVQPTFLYLPCLVEHHAYN